MRHRVVLVRGPRAAAGGGGCCSGATRPFDSGGGHRHVPPVDDVGAVYRALRAALPRDVAVEVVSPTNWVWLVPALLSDGRRRGLRGAALWRSVRAGIVVESLICDGAVLASGWLPAPAAAVAAVEAELAVAELEQVTTAAAAPGRTPPRAPAPPP
ncbi:hypothetical protein [Modestobacter sp. VKM Ac-2985]|uniref:hypothetical protein n=1 Tax=Modestobacter sp. VKM Ac-2985 TaxID=3004139 RepID=UPI0022AB83D4|nr:hypothetical protein [Modestobacter sp. VKM Ac-2985]MCZ2837108.1 hypothetical protein [Modestobacter sp. VKM Ac-2985]